MRYRVEIEQDEDGVFVVTVPSLPGCLSDGRTREEALERVAEAIRLYVDTHAELGLPIPLPLAVALLTTLC